MNNKTFKQILLEKISAYELALNQLRKDLSDYNALPENNVYASMEDAYFPIYGILYSYAELDCEGSYNCGEKQYSQLFTVNGIIYKAELSVEYNRHDKTYYYVEDTDFKVLNLNSGEVIPPPPKVK